MKIMHKREWLPEDSGTKSRLLRFGAEILFSGFGTKALDSSFRANLDIAQRSAVDNAEQARGGPGGAVEGHDDAGQE